MVTERARWSRTADGSEACLAGRNYALTLIESFVRSRSVQCVNHADNTPAESCSQADKPATEQACEGAPCTTESEAGNEGYRGFGRGEGVREYFSMNIDRELVNRGKLNWRRLFAAEFRVCVDELTYQECQNFKHLCDTKATPYFRLKCCHTCSLYLNRTFNE